MSDTTPILALPVLVPGQAQPYVTHNGALRRLDMLAQTVVEAFDAETPPELPEAGRVYALGAVPTAAWAGHPLSLAAWIDETWLFIDLQPGWRACSRDSGTLRIWDGAAWGLPAADLDQVAGLGIRTDHDATNRLSVKAEATLLSHDGAGHQLKINKKTGTDTASLLYQSNWSGRAETGLAGSDDWSLKVSPDGSAWTEALVVNATTGSVNFMPDAAAAAAVLKSKTGYDASLKFSPQSADTWSIIGTTGGALAFYDFSTLHTPMTVKPGAVANTLVMDSSSRIGIGGATPNAKLHVTQAETATPSMLSYCSSAAFASSALTTSIGTAASSSFSFVAAYSSGGDLEFRVRGDGTVTADGSFTGGGADYAEYFEWADGNPGEEDRRGLSVVLVGDKIRAGQPGEQPIGVISVNPSVVGDGDIDRWTGKYLCDDFGDYLLENYEVIEWTETLTRTEEGETVTEEVPHSHAADQLPDGVTVPEDATRLTRQRRMLNPAFDPTQEYLSRADRPEWAMVGLMGKLRLRKGQPVDARWLKMRDISVEVEEWLVR